MRVPVGLKAAVVGLLVMGAYAAFSNSIPQIESRPPQELKLEGGTVTPAQLVSAIVTEVGVARAPYRGALRRLVRRQEPERAQAKRSAGGSRRS